MVTVKEENTDVAKAVAFRSFSFFHIFIRLFPSILEQMSVLHKHVYAYTCGMDTSLTSVCVYAFVLINMRVYSYH